MYLFPFVKFAILLEIKGVNIRRIVNSVKNEKLAIFEFEEIC